MLCLLNIIKYCGSNNKKKDKLVYLDNSIVIRDICNSEQDPSRKGLLVIMTDNLKLNLINFLFDKKKLKRACFLLICFITLTCASWQTIHYEL